MISSINDKMIINDIRDLAESLNTHSFEPLSSGLGLGELKPVSLGRGEPMIISETLQINPRAHVSRIEPIKQKSLPSRWGIWLMAHVIDIFVVASTLAIAISVATFLQHSTSGSSFNRGDLLKLTHQIGAVKAVIVVYVVFGLYWILFKLLSGDTVGHLWRRKILRRGMERRYLQNLQNKW